MDPNFHKAWPARADILSYHQGAEQDGRTVSDRSPELSLMQHLDEVSQEPGISPKLRARAKIFSCKLPEDRARLGGANICSDA